MLRKYESIVAEQQKVCVFRIFCKKAIRLAATDWLAMTLYLLKKLACLKTKTTDSNVRSQPVARNA